MCQITTLTFQEEEDEVNLERRAKMARHLRRKAQENVKAKRNQESGKGSKKVKEGEEAEDQEDAIEVTPVPNCSVRLHRRSCSIPTNKRCKPLALYDENDPVTGAAGTMVERSYKRKYGGITDDWTDLSNAPMIASVRWG